ncbi:MAG: GNAT family N-acetyltransferase [Planctomycetota bacterium]|nr:GNAT family N-acetyltransferase [Planctomycetota bacterium]
MPALGPVTLRGTFVRLEPLRPEHAAGLLAAGQTAEELWPWMPERLVTPDAVERWIEAARKEEIAGTSYAFAIFDAQSARVLGSTRFLDVVAAHKGCEIGWTWYARDVWGTKVNPECKLLLLRHAFETWGALRVQLKTDHLNTRSQAAIKKLGAKHEGVLRNHRLRPDGTIRHTVMFSVTPEEWPAVKQGLEARVL